VELVGRLRVVGAELLEQVLVEVPDGGCVYAHSFEYQPGFVEAASL